MWFSVVYSVIDNDTRHHSGQNVDSRAAAEWVRNEFRCCLTTENTDSDLKVQALHYANELLVRVRLSFQKLLQTRLRCRNNTKRNVWEKSNDAYSLSIRVQTTINHISILTFLCSLWQYQRQRKCFLSERELRKALRDTLWREQRGWDPVIFDWFVLSMRMQVILDSSFARLGSAPIWGGKKVEFRDWTTNCSEYCPNSCTDKQPYYLYSYRYRGGR